MKKSLSFIISFCVCLHLPYAQVVFSEDFESGSFDGNGWSAAASWKIGTAATISSPEFTIPNHSLFAGVNDDAAGIGVSSFGAITSPQIDLAGMSAALLQFQVYFRNGDYDADETARVLISKDNMTTWQILLEIEGNTIWQNLTAYLGSEYAGQKINLAFEYNDNNGWNFGFCVDNIKVEAAPDYFAVVKPGSSLDFTVSTPRQMTEPLRFVHKFENYGLQPLEDITFRLTVQKGNTVILVDSHTVANIPPGGFIWDTIYFQPTALGKHSFRFAASHPTLGNNFYQRNLLNAFELHESVVGIDDGERDLSLGFSFGDPSWYGYYGSEIELRQPDTLIGISVWMVTSTAGTYNLTVNGLEDGTGPPTDEVYHSAPIEINANYNNWDYHELQNPLPLNAATYVFAVGQDTIQGLMGHGFDSDRRNPGYWIVSPVAGGGYPWYNIGPPNNHTLMIRPHFKEQPIVMEIPLLLQKS
jgi:hypothetical protein